MIEDAACALGSELSIDGRWERIGRPHGVMACFSFHPRKVITTGDGGMITTHDGALADAAAPAAPARDDRRPPSREKDPLARESFVEPAYNYRMTDLEAAIGRPQLARLDAFLADRRRLAAVFAAALEDHPVLEAPVERASARVELAELPHDRAPGLGAGPGPGAALLPRTRHRLPARASPTPTRSRPTPAAPTASAPAPCRSARRCAPTR